ncbi:MAG: YfhO family protein [Bacillota bacterium]|nr:YfhO family protein [Bacillota bacterium]
MKTEELRVKENPAKAIKNSIVKNRLILAAFFLPALIMVLAFASMGVFPFGNEQIAVIDFYHQYLPLIEELQYKLHHGGSLFYTWNGAGGCNFWNVIAYQAASPFNLILILFPEKFLARGLTLILIIRIGLAGSFMFCFLKKTYEKVSFATVGFATLYALCAYVMAYYWNIMWMDAVMLLPLCILGLRRLIDGGKPVLYVVTLAIIVFSNYYIGITVCIFIMTYYFSLYFGSRREGGFKSFAKTSLRTLLYSILALAMTAVMLLPTWISMKKASAMKSTFPDHCYFYKDPLDVVNQLLPFSKFSYMEGLPNICSGLIVVILLIFYFMSRTINLRGKIANALYLVFLYFSMNVNYLDYIWHGFHFPNMLPFRYSFVVSFILIGMAYEAFIRIDEIKVSHLWAVLAGGIGYYLIADKILKDVVTDFKTFFYMGILLLLLYVAVMVIYRKGLLKARMFRYVFVAVIVTEMICVSMTDINTIGSTSESEYSANSIGIAKAVDYVSDEFDRVEIDNPLTLNDPARFHYMGMTQFASSINSETNTLYEKIGLEAEPGSNRVKYTQTTPILNAMLDMKYLIGKNRPVLDKSYKLVKEFGSTRLYKTKYPMSIGYMAPYTIHTWDCDSADPFVNQDDYVRAMTSNIYSNLFSEVEKTGMDKTNAKVTENGENNYDIAPVDGASETHMILNFKSDKTQKYYVYADSSIADYITVDIEGQTEDVDIDENYAAVVNVGEIEEGTEFKIDFQFELGKSGTALCLVRTMDEEKWEKAYEMMSRNLMEVTDFGDTYVKGTIDVDESGMLVTSIPYDDGWTLKVDGKEKEINELVGGVWISTPLDPGTHEIELHFRPAGFIPGLIITILSILLLIGLSLARDRLIGRRHQQCPLEESDCNI